MAEASDGQEALRSAEQTHPDVAIIDISMPLLNGVDAARELKKSSPQTKVILLTQHDEDQYVTESLRAGVNGYVLKCQAADALVHAIQEVCRGSIYLSPNISRAVVDAYLSKTQSSTDSLSGRERQVLQLVGEGKSTKDIAVHLGISVKTAESHRARLMKKLDIHENEETRYPRNSEFGSLRHSPRFDPGLTPRPKGLPVDNSRSFHSVEMGD